MAILDESFYDPVPGYTQTRRRRTETPPPADVPRGGMPVPGSDPLAGVPERDIIPETFADPLSPTRSMRYGPGDERDLSVPTPPPPVGWRPPSGELPPPPVDPTAPRTPFADAPGQSLADTLASGRRMQAEQDRLGLTTADMDYIRTYGRNAWDARQSKYAPPTTRADYLARQGQNLAISVAERNAAQQELSRIERDNADARRREMWAAEQAQNLRLAEGAWQNALAVQNARNEGLVAQAAAEGNARVEAAKAQGASAEQVAAVQAEADKAVAAAKAQAELALAREFPWAAGGGNSSINRATGEIKTAEGAELDDNDPKNWKKVGTDLYNVRTKQRISGYDARREIDRQIAALRAKVAAGNAFLNPQAVQDEIAALEARKQELGLDALPAEPAPAPAEPAAAAPAPAPTPAPAPAGRRRFEG